MRGKLGVTGVRPSSSGDLVRESSLPTEVDIMASSSENIFISLSSRSKFICISLMSSDESTFILGLTSLSISLTLTSPPMSTSGSSSISILNCTDSFLSKYESWELDLLWHLGLSLLSSLTALVTASKGPRLSAVSVPLWVDSGVTMTWSPESLTSSTGTRDSALLTGLRDPGACLTSPGWLLTICNGR